jgi:hypothetical protein
MSDIPKLTVVPFIGGDVNNIPSGLRNLADLIEQGCQEGQVLGLSDSYVFAYVSINEYGDTVTGALGKCTNKYHAIGILHTGANKLGEG